MIENIVVLMLENRAFDHLLGAYPGGPAFEGLKGGEANYENPLTESGLKVAVTLDAPTVPDVDPGPDHDVPNVHIQLFGRTGPYPDDPGAPHNNGFLYDYAQVTHDVNTAAHVMRCHAPENVPTLTALAREFAICDHWFSSVPGPTWPNRFFAHAATSGGHTDNAIRIYGMRTIYENLHDAGKSWRIYFHDFPQSLALEHQLRFAFTNYDYIDEFFGAAQSGTLPHYTFIEPRYFNEGPFRANDMHPIHGVVGGEQLVADVYEALRKGPQWEKTLFVVVCDEHGGLYDHVLPPKCVNPDDLVSPEFDFTHLGVRVPAIVVSPWIPKGTIASTVYDHTSILATARDAFGLGRSLTRRDAEANTLLPLLTETAPRADAPLTLPRAADETLALHEAAQVDHRPLSRFQTSLVTCANALAKRAPAMLPEPLSSALATTEREGAVIAKFAYGALRVAARGVTL